MADQAPVACYCGLYCLPGARACLWTCAGVNKYCMRILDKQGVFSFNNVAKERVAYTRDGFF